MFWAGRFPAGPGWIAGRISSGSRGVFELETEEGCVRAELSGRLEYAAESALDLPVAGDWVAAAPTDPALIMQVLERRSLFTRTLEGGERQAMAANVDVAFLVAGLDGDFNWNRLHRYLVLAREAGAQPVIVLNKSDLRVDTPSLLREALALAPAVSVSALHDELASKLGSFVQPGETAALLGSSGAGKSTIVNSLLGGPLQPTTPVRASDSRGRHTTTNRTLFPLPQGWLLLDMPGIRTVGIGPSQEAIDETFADLAALAAECRFRDCSHSGEPGCAVAGRLAPERLSSFRKLLREAAYQKTREDPMASQAQKRRWKRIHAAMRKRQDARDPP
jgi:ribosome biogenesis GTPase